MFHKHLIKFMNRVYINPLEFNNLQYKKDKAISYCPQNTMANRLLL